MKLRYNSNRFGWFIISGIFIVENPAITKEIMGRCIIVHAAPEPHYDVIKYKAISDDFDEIKEFGLIPEYEIIAEKDPSGKVTWEFKRITDDDCSCGYCVDCTRMG